MNARHLPAVGSVAILGVASTVVIGLAPVGSADPTYQVVTHGGDLIVRDGPSRQAQPVDRLSNGEWVSLECQTHGEMITDGMFSDTDLWDRITPNRYVSDAYIDTGRSGMVVPKCNNTPEQPPAPPPTVETCRSGEGIGNDSAVLPLCDGEVPAAVSPLYQQVMDNAVGALRPGHTRLEGEPLQAGASPDDGVVTVVFFIPFQHVGGVALGDNRGPTSDPSASARVTFSWDVARGHSYFDAAPSETRLGSRNAYSVARCASRGPDDSLTDGVPRAYSTVCGLDKTDGPEASTTVWISAANSWVGILPGAAWTIDGTLTVARAASGGYSLRWVGNGYPEIEAYYYPRHEGARTPAGGDSRSTAIANAR